MGKSDRSAEFIELLKFIPDADSPPQGMEVTFMNDRKAEDLVSVLDNAGFVLDESLSTRMVQYPLADQICDVPLPFGFEPVEGAVVSGYFLRSIEGSDVDFVALSNFSGHRNHEGVLKACTGINGRVEYNNHQGRTAEIGASRDRVKQAIKNFYNPNGELFDKQA